MCRLAGSWSRDPGNVSESRVFVGSRTRCVNPAADAKESDLTTHRNISVKPRGFRNFQSASEYAMSEPRFHECPDSAAQGKRFFPYHGKQRRTTQHVLLHVKPEKTCYGRFVDGAFPRRRQRSSSVSMADVLLRATLRFPRSIAK